MNCLYTFCSRKFRFFPSLLILIAFVHVTSSCPPGWYDCGNEQCISSLWHCDGTPDCENEQDEVDCPSGKPGQVSHSHTCPDRYFLCPGSDVCIPHKWVCDGHIDCPNSHDEQNCTRPPEACLGGFICGSHECIPHDWRCDDVLDCNDGSDEHHCPRNGTTTECTRENGRFLCSPGECISLSYLCNGHKDCRNGADESIDCATGPSSGNCSRVDCSHGCHVLPSGDEHCVCNHGYSLTFDMKNCEDINECAIDGWCSHRCINKPGSFKCVCQDGYVLQPDERTCLADPRNEPLMIFSDGSSIRGMYLSHTGNRSRHNYSRYFEIHRATGHVVGTAMDPKTNMIYWADLGSSHSAVYVTPLAESGTSTRHAIISGGLKDPQEIVFDWVANNIYVSDSGIQKIIVCKSDGTVCSILHENRHRPRSLSLDPARGHLYWTEWGDHPGIYRSGMDGSDFTVIANTSVVWANGLTFDPTTSRVYWADARSNTIEYYDTLTKKRRIIVQDRVFHPFSIAVFEDNLYWSDWMTSSLDACEKFHGRNQTTIIRESGKHIMGLHVFHPSMYLNTIANPCWSSTCSHLCLIAPNKSSRCACPPHMVLAADGMTCTASNVSYVLVASKRSIKKILPEYIGRDVVEDLSLPGNYSISDFTYDPEDGVLYIFECPKNCSVIAIGMAETNDKTKKIGMAKKNSVALIAQPRARSVQGFTYDCGSRNLFWVDSILGQLNVLSTVTSRYRTLLDTLERPTDLAINPKERLLYIANLGTEPYILQAHMDGSHSSKLIAGRHVGLPVSVFYSHNTLYWADAKKGTIESMLLTEENINNNRRNIVTSGHTHIMSIGVINDTVFFTDMDSHYVYHQSASGHYLHSSIPLKGQSGETSVKKVKVVDFSTVGDHSHSGCSVNNGGCEHICVMSQSGPQCMCHSGYTAKSDDPTKCFMDSKCKPHETLCADKLQCYENIYKCDGAPDCNDGSDEFNCTECANGGFKCPTGECISASWVCDHSKDCSDGSDEANCSRGNCAQGQSACGDGQCIPTSWWCDGNTECANGADEFNCSRHACTKDLSMFSCSDSFCVPNGWVCDGESDCTNGADEANCTDKMCKEGQHRCPSNYQCIDNSLLCDGHNDCLDGSDESNCLNANKCPDGAVSCDEGHHCIYPSDLCDGHRDCSDGYDESNCTNKSCSSNETPCDLNGNNTQCIPIMWICDGENDCGDWSDEQRPHCKHREKITSTTTSRPCRDGSFPCDSGDCVPYESVCDGHRDCLDGSDEGVGCSTACSTHNCSQACQATPTGPQCSCWSGYELSSLDSRTCTDIDECDLLGHCSHFCQNTPSSFKCTCDDGYFLAADQKRCKASTVNEPGQPSHALLVYLNPERILSLDLVTHSVHEFYSTRSSDINGFDFDYEGKELFWIEEGKGTINSRKFNITNDILHTGTVKVVTKDLKNPSYLNFDWITKNIYFFTKGYIAACKNDGSYCYLVMKTGYSYISSFALAPPYGYMFFSVRADRPTSTGLIFRAEMNGLRRKAIVSSDHRVMAPTALTVDLVLKQIYWTDPDHGYVGISDFTGHRTFMTYALARPYAMSVFEDNLYISNMGTDTLTKWSKFNNGRSRTIVKRGDIKTSLSRVYHRVAQPHVNNPCLNTTCGYKSICLLGVNVTSCSCGDKYVINEKNQCGHDSQSISFYELLAGAHEMFGPQSDCDSDEECLNDGECTPDGRCKCAEGFVGINCEHKSSGNLRQPNTRQADVSNLSTTLVTIIVLVVVAVSAVGCYTRRRDIVLMSSHLPAPFMRRVSGLSSSVSGGLSRVPLYFSNPIFNRDESDQKELVATSSGLSRNISTASHFSNLCDEELMVGESASNLPQTAISVDAHRYTSHGTFGGTCSRTVSYGEDQDDLVNDDDETQLLP